MSLALTSKTEVLRKHILEKISSGQYRPSEKIDSIRALAKNYQVSKHTASQAISSLVSFGYLENRRGIGTFVLKNPGDRMPILGMPNKKLQTIGLETSTSPSNQSEFISEMMRGVLDGVRQNGYDLTLYHRDDFLLREKVDNFNLEGIIVNYLPEYRYDLLNELSDKLNLVFINNDCPSIGVPFVGLDNEKAGVIATQHLIEKGHTNIGFLFFPENTTSSQERITGYKIALAGEGLQSYCKKLDVNSVSNSYFSISSIKDELDEILGENITAVICINSTIAILVSKYLRSRGLRIPEDMALLGFDDCQIALMSDVPLTVIAQPAYKMGRKSAELCMNPFDIDEDKTTLFEPELIIREST